MNISAVYMWPGAFFGTFPFRQDKPGEVQWNLLDEVVFEFRIQNAVQVKIARDGIFEFDFSDWSPGRIADPSGGWSKEFQNRISLINSFFACFYGAFHELQFQKAALLRMTAVGANQLISRKNSGGKLAGWSEGIVAPLLAARNGPDNINNKFKYWKEDWRFSGRDLVEISTLERTAEKINEILSHDNIKAARYAELFLRASVALQNSDFQTSLTASWSIIESLLKNLFASSLTNVPSVKLKDKILGNRDLTASVISDVLLGIDKLSSDLYQQCSVARKARNKWLHDLEPIDKSAAFQGLQLASAMMENVASIRLFLLPQEGGVIVN